MVLLSRHGVQPLLRTVLGQPHSRNENHAEQKPEPESADSVLDFGTDMSYNEITDDPISTDEEGGKVLSKSIEEADEIREERARPNRTKQTLPQKKRLRNPTVYAPTSRNGAKRKSDQEHEGSSSPKKRRSPSTGIVPKKEDDEPEWVIQQSQMQKTGQRPKPRKPMPASYGKSANIHGQNADIARSKFKGGNVKPQTKRSGSTTTPEKGSRGFQFLHNPSAGLQETENNASRSKQTLNVLPRTEAADTKDRQRPKFQKMEKIDAPSENEQRDVFKMPPKIKRPANENFRTLAPIDDHNVPMSADQFDPAISDMSSPLSELDESCISDMTKVTEVSDDGPGVPLAVCPYCQTEVDPDFLLEYSKGKSRMRIREQMSFCIAHKRRTAKLDYENKGYPVIDWGNLESRFRHYDLHLITVLEDKTDSHFRQKLAETVDKGKDRNLFQAAGSGSLQGLTPGYYGTKGARLMDNYIIRKHGPKLRRLATKDKVIASRDTSGFVQAVLVPELAMKLIMDDMQVNDLKAREIMKESIGLGDVVNEDEDDVLRSTQAASQMIRGESSEEEYDTD